MLTTVHGRNSKAMPPENDNVNDVLSFVASCDSNSLKVAVAESPGIVHYKGWAGLTALHKVCLRGDLSLVKVLVEAGSDPLVSNDHNELAVMFAAKTGSLNILHYLLSQQLSTQHPATLQSTAYMLSCKDKSGRGLLHHAAMCGKILVFQYLVEVHGLSVTDTDNNLQTPLHLCCQHGNYAAAQFILKYLSHSDVILAKDKDGNNCFHLSCTHGSAELVWLLLSHYHGNLRIINIFNITNNSGQTGFDICISSSSHRHKGLAQYLRTWFKSGTFEGLAFRLKLYSMFKLLSPTALFLLTTLLAHLVVRWNQWLIVLPIGLFMAAIVGRFEHHRLAHPSMAANPVYAGLFCGGVVWSTGAYLVKMYPLSASDGGVTLYPPPLISIFLIGILYLTLFTLLRRDPGSVGAHSTAHEEEGGSSSIVKVANGYVEPARYCVYCKWIMPERCKHCRLCNTCVSGIDHHCLYLMKCVAENNHRLFICFILELMAAQIIFVLLTYQYLSYSITAPDSTSQHWSDMIVWCLKFDGVSTTLVLCNVFGLAWESKLLLDQIANISRGYTTLLKPSFIDYRNEGLTLQQRINNIFRFFLAKPAIKPRLNHNI